MTRRELIIMAGKLGLLAVPFSSKGVRALMKGNSESGVSRFVLIYDSTAVSAIDYRKLLDKASPYLSSQDPAWLKKLTILDQSTQRNEIQSFMVKHGRNTEKLTGPVLIAVPETEDFEGEVEIWNEDWLRAKESRYTDACYPISGGWWSVEGDWNPSITKVRNHLYKSPNHKGGKFELPWLELLKFEELQSLHSDHHREMTKKGKVYWANVNKECPQFSFVR